MNLPFIYLLFLLPCYKYLPLSAPLLPIENAISDKIRISYCRWCVAWKRSLTSLADVFGQGHVFVATRLLKTEMHASTQIAYSQVRNKTKVEDWSVIQHITGMVIDHFLYRHIQLRQSNKESWHPNSSAWSTSHISMIGQCKYHG